MGLQRIHSYLVHPAKGADDPPAIGGTQVPLNGRLAEMLGVIFERASTECDIEILFSPDESGRQQNECRDRIVAYATHPTLRNGREVAARLQGVTTHRSGLGLLFLMTGTNGNAIRLVISRFPADQGIIAEEHRDQLSVEFLERVFMKNAKAYKSVFYESDSRDRGFWDGRAVDRQVSGPKELSDYWIRDFLASELRTTAAAGTKRLAVALRTAIQTSQSLDVRQQLVSAASLLRGRDHAIASARALVDGLGLRPEAQEVLERQLPRPELMEEVFEFDSDEFDRHLLYRLVELDNGGLLMAQDSQFADVFDTQVVDEKEGVLRFSTQGRVVDERLRKTK
jgi:hypothetical protein